MLNESSNSDHVHELSKKLSKIFSDFTENQKCKPSANQINKKIINLTRAKIFQCDIDEQNNIQNEIDLLNKQLHDDSIDITISASDLCLIQLGLNLLGQSYEAEKFVKTSVGQSMTNEQRWSKVAELMLLKEPGEKLSRHGSDEFCYYWGLFNAGVEPREASEKVYEKFKFQSQEACDKWLQREIAKRKKENPELYEAIKSPNTYPRIKAK
jgi:hypothetical protein